MMPWEHVLVGYVGYSLFVHVVYRGVPSSRATLVVVFASLLPDLIDKPLAWEFGVFTSGYALGHSLLFTLPLSIAVGWLASSRGRPRIGWAFAVGLLLHPVADLVPEYLFDGTVRFGSILWPLRGGGEGYERGFAGEFRVNVGEYVHWIGTQMASGDLDGYLLVVLGLGALGVSLWIYDGMPVGRETLHVVRRAARTVARLAGV